MTRFLDPSIATDPLDLIVEGNMRVRDFQTREQCAAVVMRLDMDIDGIIAQIADDEASPGRRAPGWRTRAQSAIRWKKRVRSALNVRAAELIADRPKADDRRRVVLDTIRFELGDAEFERLVSLAKRRHPHLFVGGGGC